MKDWVLRLLWKGLPKKGISRFVGYMARKPFSRRLIPYYIKHFQIDLTPVKKPLDQFENLLDFFVREYHQNARPIDPRQDVIVSPVDGAVSQIGTIEDGMLLQAKGISYSVLELLGGNEEHTKRFLGGKFVTIYLSPRDYHRIHMPIQGEISEITYIPGKLYPVNKLGVRLIPGLFAKNERVISYITSPIGIVALIKVGATNVGSIRVTFDEKIVTNPRRRQKVKHIHYAKPQRMRKGDELGRFEFGSTVILLFEPNKIEWLIPEKPGVPVQMGQPIARMEKNEE